VPKYKLSLDPVFMFSLPRGQWRSQHKFVLGQEMFDFRRATVFCLGYRLSKHKTIRYYKNFGGNCLPWLHPCTEGRSHPDPRQLRHWLWTFFICWLLLSGQLFAAIKCVSAIPSQSCCTSYKLHGLTNVQ